MERLGVLVVFPRFMEKKKKNIKTPELGAIDSQNPFGRDNPMDARGLLLIHISILFSIGPTAILDGRPAAQTGGPAPLSRIRKVVILAGEKSHGPVGNGIHDYLWSARLLKAMLEHSNVRDQLRVEVHPGGWPRDPRTLEDADTVMVIADGRDGNQYQEAPHLASDDRVRFFDRQMKRGCGLVTFHFSTFAPEKYRDRVLDWNGGYFQWETDGKRQWYSAIETKEAEVRLARPEHPVLRGVEPFTMREEFYFNLRLRPDGIVPLWTVPALPGREPDGRVVAWARERPDGGRGFGTTAGHFYDNWKLAPFRRTILNAIVWTAHADVPPGGVEARFYTHEEIRAALGITDN